MSRRGIVGGLFTGWFAATLAGQSIYLLQTLAGSDQVGDGGAATAALIGHAEGLTLDNSGNLYIADAEGHRVRRVAPGGKISTVAGTGHAGMAGEGGPASAAQLNAPYGLAVDRDGNLYIADLGNARIRRVSRDGTITTVAGGGATAALLADGHPAVDAQLKAPRNVAVDQAGNLYFSDFGDHRVYEVTVAGKLLRIAGSGTAGLSGDGGPALLARLNSPAGLSVDATDTLYIADSGNGRIRKVWRGVISTLGDTGIAGAAPVVPVRTPTGVRIDSDGSLVIADAGNEQILRVTALMEMSALAQPARDVVLDGAGTIYSCSGPYVYRRLRSGALSYYAGSGNYAYAGDGGQAYGARLNQPAGIARDRSGALYFADQGNHRVRKILPDGTIYTIAGTGVAGMAGDSGPGTSAQLNSPGGIAVDGLGNVYIADTGNHRVRRLDATGRLYTVAGTGDRGLAGDGGLAVRARIDTPMGLALDIDGNLLIADTGNHVVRRLLRDGTIELFAGNANRGFGGDGGLPAGASLDTPTALAVDSYGNVYIADSGNRRIRRVGAAGAFGAGVISTYPAGSTTLWRWPRGMAMDAAGNLYVADAGDQRVYRLEANGRLSAIAGDGWQGFNGEAGSALSMRMDTPLELVVDPAGNLFVSDSGNGRIRKLSPFDDPNAPAQLEVPTVLTNAASMKEGPIAAGEIVAMFGSGFGTMSTTQVLVGGRVAPLFYVGSTQINLQVPYTLPEGDTAEVIVLVNGVLKARVTTGVVAANPALFPVAVNEDGTLNSVENPAMRGSVVTFYGTGEGRVTPQPADGVAASWPYPAPVLPVSLKIGEYQAELLYAQAAPGFMGLLQVNARVPAGYAPSGVLAVVLRVGTASSTGEVVLAVK